MLGRGTPRHRTGAGRATGMHSPVNYTDYGRGVTTVPELTSDRLSAEFPGNEWLVAEIYDKYKADKSSVDAKWVQIFERLEATPASAAAGASGAGAAQTVKATPQDTGKRTSAAPAQKSTGQAQ